MSKWYAYVDVSGQIVVHPYRRPKDLKASFLCDYVIRVSQPYKAKDRQEAEAKAKAELYKRED